jgi:hypothetical protein
MEPHRKYKQKFRKIPALRVDPDPFSQEKLHSFNTKSLEGGWYLSLAFGQHLKPSVDAVVYRSKTTNQPSHFDMLSK